MTWQDSIFELIDMRSFSNLWYWIGLAVLWSTVSHWVVGVPYDSILRARRQKPDSAMSDLQDLVRVNVKRVLYIAEVSGAWIALFASAVLTALALMAFYYKVEFAQALFLLVMPMSLVALLTLRTARRIATEESVGDMLLRRLLRHRFATQAIGLMSIFVTAMFGMYKNLHVGPLGGF